MVLCLYKDKKIDPGIFLSQIYLSSKFMAGTPEWTEKWDLTSFTEER